MMYGQFKVCEVWGGEWEWEIQLCNAKGLYLSASLLGDYGFARKASARRAMMRFAKKLGIVEYKAGGDS